MMICPNKKCRYEFFEREEGYVACPSCGQEIEKNMPTNPAGRSRAIVKILKYKDYLKLREKGITSLFYLSFFLVVIIIPFFILKDLPPAGYSESDHIVTVGEYYSPPIVMVVLFFLLFAGPFNNYKFLKGIIGEHAWYCSTWWFKVLNWLVLAVTIFLFWQIVLPLYIHFLQHSYKQYDKISYFRDVFVEFASMLIWTAMLIVGLDLNDLYQRHLSKQLDRKHFT
ncbi:hypothetical protein [Streptococcus oricebi]|uniref:Uncharacterized protein n=1 Tax=Streptococcus oricebi TaxID=1547447 RepID=A0ABS5B2Y1_9STRE|nr:hypothetical protein [Streptococcus oricebi]MBP2623167.1 hypothetical protein [Streptococcus oricebi]